MMEHAVTILAENAMSHRNLEFISSNLITISLLLTSEIIFNWRIVIRLFQTEQSINGLLYILFCKLRVL